MRKRTLLQAVTAVTAVATALVAQSPASAAPVVHDPLVTGLAGPLHIEVSQYGTFVAQSFAGSLDRVKPNGQLVNITREPGEVAGFDVGSRGVAYAFSGGDEDNPQALLKWISHRGHTKMLADIGAFEAAHNPDAGQTYGFQGLDEECAASVPAEAGGGDPYTGIVESHPYAVAKARHGWYVADAAANALLQVKRTGKVKVVEVFKPLPTVITQDAAEATGLPECTVGATYNFEPVPTDVELRPSGMAFVSLLPGGPEDPSLGARGRVMRVNPHNGRSRVVASGFVGASNLAIGRRGKIFVAELFGGKISVIRRNGSVGTYAELPLPAAVEERGGNVYAAYNVFENGSIAKITRH